MQHKNYVHKIITISIAFLMSIANYANDIRIRSQSVDTARELAGWTNHVNLYDVGDTYGTFAITPEYTQSFNSRQIARSLFGSAIIQNESCDSTCDSNTDKFSSFRVSGSQAAGRQAGDLLADYFGLPLDYQSVVNVRPIIQNFLVDFDLFVGLDKCFEGLWVRIHAPVVYAKWKLRMEEDQVNKGSVGYPIGYFAPVAIPASALNTSFVSYLQGNAPDLSSYGVTFDPLQNGIFENGVVSSTETCSTVTGKQHTTRLSDIRFAIGQNFWQCEDYHIGAGLLIAAPTGSKVNDKYLFRPFVGNGHHWEFGAKITSHYTLWRGCDDDKSLGLYIDADVTTLLATRQFRVFDICGAGDNSKYMLAEQMTDQVTNNLATSVPNGQTPIITNVLYQFANKLTPVANFAAQNVKVNQDLQLDLTAMFNYTHCKFAFDLGYNFWMTSRERIRPYNCEDLLLRGNHVYALKGDASLFGFAGRVTTPAGYQQLSATESGATICSGTNMIIGNGITAATSTNANVDNAGLAVALPSHVALNTTPTSGIQTNTSAQPIFLANQNIDYAGALAKGMSHKIFGHISYTWADCECYMPYIGIGGKAEFVPKINNCNEVSVCGNSTGCGKIETSCVSCGDNSGRKTNINEWGIWLKGGVSF